jgi:hypothetical protein
MKDVENSPTDATRAIGTARKLENMTSFRKKKKSTEKGKVVVKCQKRQGVGVPVKPK